jgi:hypothetical protein
MDLDYKSATALQNVCRLWTPTATRGRRQGLTAFLSRRSVAGLEQPAGRIVMRRTIAKITVFSSSGLVTARSPWFREDPPG